MGVGAAAEPAAGAAERGTKPPCAFAMRPVPGGSGEPGGSGSCVTTGYAGGTGARGAGHGMQWSAPPVA